MVSRVYRHIRGRVYAVGLAFQPVTLRAPMVIKSLGVDIFCGINGRKRIYRKKEQREKTEYN
jgi:hypothetical protein